MMNQEYSSLERVKAIYPGVNFSNFTIFMLVFGLILYFVDTGMDIGVAIQHYENGNYHFFSLTLLVVLAPSLMSYREVKKFVKRSKLFGIYERLATLIFCLTTLGQVFVIITCLYNGFRYRFGADERFKTYPFLKFCVCCIMAMKLTFIQIYEPAGQLALQLYIQVTSTSLFPFDTSSKSTFYT